VRDEEEEFTMMLNLTDAERAFLMMLMEDRLVELRSEIAKDGRLDWMVELKKRADLVKAILDKLHGFELSQAI
jgi:hypothetical protein